MTGHQYFRGIAAVAIACTVLAGGRAQAVQPGPAVDKPPATEGAATHETGVQENVVQVNNWNLFFRALEALHEARIKSREVKVSERLRDLYGEKASIREQAFTDAKTGFLMATLQYETKPPGRLQSIEIFIDGPDGRVIRDYYARYLPEHRNAPIQTLINLHGYKDGMHGFRQFDASGALIYESCSGTLHGKDIDIHLEEDDLPPPASVSLSEAYVDCFNTVPEEAGKYLDPTVEIPKQAAPGKSGKADVGGGPQTAEQVHHQIDRLTQRLVADGRRADLYVKRGEAYFLVHDFDAAINDFSRAIALDDSLDDAYFGRGMALGRRGDVADGIADLSVYIKRNPDNSRAHTKRGVRYIWLGDEAKAEADLTRAVELDANNAEAHDDLGVVKAKRGALAEARAHFETTIRLDPTYQKAYHNLALVLHMTGDNAGALSAIEQSLRLSPQNRDSMLLKATLLDNLGRGDEAAKLRENAAFVPPGNWSERSALR